jgi:hypothetical protein
MYSLLTNISVISRDIRRFVSVGLIYRVEKINCLFAYFTSSATQWNEREIKIDGVKERERERERERETD